MINPQHQYFQTGVQFVRPELRCKLPQYQRIMDCLAGEDAVKHRKTLYLPQPNALDQSPENVARYKAYLTRAVFYNVTGRTWLGLVGFLFIREPKMELAPELEPMRKDASGDGMPLPQLAKKAVGVLMAVGRAGLLADFPQLASGATAQQVSTGEIKPMIRVYKSGDIVNWRKRVEQGKTFYTLIVLREEYDDDTDPFVTKRMTQYRVLRLENGGVTVTLWKSESSQRMSAFAAGPSSQMTDHAGKALTEIPFEFIGCEDNDAEPDDPPLDDLALLNLAHYRNSADFEEASFLVGQPTPWVSGITEEWATKVLKGTVQLGSRGLIPLPEGGQAGLLQAAENTLPAAGMEHKEKQMVALGAKLIEDKSVQRTATEADIENVSETSILANIAQNVSTAFTRALAHAAKYLGATTPSELKLHENLGLSTMSPQERQQLIAEWQAGAIVYEEMREALRQVGVATWEDAEAKAQAQTEQQEKLQLIMDTTIASKPPGNEPPAGKGGTE